MTSGQVAGRSGRGRCPACPSSMAQAARRGPAEKPARSATTGSQRTLHVVAQLDALAPCTCANRWGWVRTIRHSCSGRAGRVLSRAGGGGGNGRGGGSTNDRRELIDGDVGSSVGSQGRQGILVPMTQSLQEALEKNPCEPTDNTR